MKYFNLELAEVVHYLISSENVEFYETSFALKKKKKLDIALSSLNFFFF